MHAVKEKHKQNKPKENILGLSGYMFCLSLSIVVCVCVCLGKHRKLSVTQWGTCWEERRPGYPPPLTPHSLVGSGSSHFHRPRSGGMGGVGEAEGEGRRRKEKV